MDIYKNRHIVRIKGSSATEADDPVALEKKVRISVNGVHALSLYCTPAMIREFVTGIIFNESLIIGEWCADRMSIEYGDEVLIDVPSSGSLAQGEFAITSGCAGGISFQKAMPQTKITDGIAFDQQSIKDVFSEFQKKSEGYRLTGGLHSAALSDGQKILAFAEDIGRHNAVDKVIGYALLEHIPFQGNLLLASGRVSSEIVYKCVRCSIPLLVSRAAPTTLALDVAEAAGITVVGFARGERLNIYTERQRVRL